MSSFDEAKTWYESPAYQGASQNRCQGGDHNIAIVDGH
jgi:uncharacterized protein (DUF1330 family)